MTAAAGVTLLEQLRKRVRLDEDGFPADEDFVVLSVGDTRAVVALVEAAEVLTNCAHCQNALRSTGANGHGEALRAALAAFTEDKQGRIPS